MRRRRRPSRPNRPARCACWHARRPAWAIDHPLGQPDRLALNLVYAADNEDRRGNAAQAADLYQRALTVYNATGDVRNAEALRQRLANRPTR